jgi:hypothetical protein
LDQVSHLEAEISHEACLETTLQPFMIEVLANKHEDVLSLRSEK